MREIAKSIKRIVSNKMDKNNWNWYFRFRL